MFFLTLLKNSQKNREFKDKFKLYRNMINDEYKIRNAHPTEFKEIGKLMVQVYSQLEGFPKEDEQPNYYKMLANIGDLTNNPDTELLVAVSSDNKIAGGCCLFWRYAILWFRGNGNKRIKCFGI